jgi:hypothetical protein
MPPLQGRRPPRRGAGRAARTAGRGAGAITSRPSPRWSVGGRSGCLHSWCGPVSRASCAISPDPPPFPRGACPPGPDRRGLCLTSPERAAGSPVREQTGRAPAPGETDGYSRTTALMVSRRAAWVCRAGVDPSSVPNGTSTAWRRAPRTESKCRWVRSSVPKVPSTADRHRTPWVPYPSRRVLGTDTPRCQVSSGRAR